MKCKECDRECDFIEELEDDEDKVCCKCGNLGYDEKCMECRQDEMEELADYAVDKYKDDMMDAGGL